MLPNQEEDSEMDQDQESSAREEASSVASYMADDKYSSSQLEVDESGST